MRARVTRAARHLLFASLCALGSVPPLAAAAEGCGADTGSMCGGAEPDAASVRSAHRPSTDTGNPINLVTGNKYQREPDYRAPDSALEWVRHYNSRNGDYEVGFGQGWSGAYDTRLYRAGDGYDIVQSDGRRLLFRVPGTDMAGRAVVRATAPSDGVVAERDGQHVWTLPDGRALSFRGSFLIRIDYPGPRFLSLHYRERRVATVTDESGRTLAFAYTPGRVGLKGYERREFAASAGRLASVTLPDGGVIGYDYDNLGNLTRVRYPDGTHRRYRYEDKAWPHHLTGLTDRTGRRLARWTYHSDGAAASAEHADGVERVTLEYEPPAEAGGIGTTRVTNGVGDRSVYTWRRDARAGHALLLSSEGPGCATCPVTGMRYAYTPEHQLASATHAGGTARRYVYDVAGRLLETWESAPGLPERRVLRRAYDGDDALPSVIARPSVDPAKEHVTEIVRDADRLPVTVTERGFAPLGTTDADGFEPIERTTRLEHDAEGRPVALDGPRTDVEDIVRFRHDGQGRLAGVDRPGGRSIDIVERDAGGRATLFRAGTRTPVRLGFDANGHVASIEQGGRTVRYRHDAEGRPLSLTDPDGRVTTLTRDAAARLVGVEDDLGRLAAFGYDDESRVVETSFAGLDGETIRSASYVRDALGRLERMTRRTADLSGGGAHEQTLDFAYDAQDRLLAAIDVGTGARAELDRDAAGRLSSLTVPDAALGTATTTLHRDAAGRESGVTDPRRNRARVLRDDFGRVVIESDPDRGTVRYRHDEAGNRTRREDAAGRVTRWTWDAANRPLRRETADGTTRYAYHPSNGQLAWIDDGTTRETFVHDVEARLIEHARHLDGRTFVTRYAHDAAGRVIRKVLPDGQSLRYHYRGGGAGHGTLRAITRESLFGLRQETLVAEIDTDARDGASGHLAHNGLRTARTFAPNGEPRSIDIAGALRLEYTFDAAGDIVGIAENGVAARYAYRDGRLIGADTLAGTFAYAYDASGNRTAERVRRGDGTSVERRHRYAPDGQGNRLLASTDPDSGTSTAYRPDAHGAPRAGARDLTYEYDADDRPVRVLERGTLLAEYVYNGFGERVKKTVHRGDERRVTYFLYDGARLSAEIDGASAAIRNTVHVDERPVALLIGQAAYAIHTDQLGTPRIVTDDAGVTVWQASYTPFGEARVSVGTLAFAHRFPGQHHDAETGTHYNYLRDYDPATGRYLTPDPLGLGGGPNAYVYAANDPLGHHDALGLKPTAEFGQSGGAWLIGAAQYAELTTRYEAGDAPAYYDYLHELTGHAIFDEFAESLRPYRDQEAITDVSPILLMLRDLGQIGGFSQIERFACTVDRRPIYRIPEIGTLVETAFQAAGVQLGAMRYVEGAIRGTFSFGTDLIAWAADLSPFGMLADVLRERGLEDEIPAWVPSLDEGLETGEYVLSVAEAIVRDPSLIWESIRDPIVRDWAEGRYGEVVANVSLDVGAVIGGYFTAERIAQLLAAVKRADTVMPGEFAATARAALAQARSDNAELGTLIEAARESDTLEDFLATAGFTRAETARLVESGSLTRDELPFLPPRSTNPRGLTGVDFEEYLVENLGGRGSFRIEGREFDGAVGDTWYEAKSGEYWNTFTQPGSDGYRKFQSDMGQRQRIAEENGVTYEVHSNTPIPEHVKSWLERRGIGFTEHLS